MSPKTADFVILGFWCQKFMTGQKIMKKGLAFVAGVGTLTSVYGQVGQKTNCRTKSRSEEFEGAEPPQESAGVVGWGVSHREDAVAAD